ncbi:MULTISPECIES: hypothetical protein [Bradyrhizobium]|uniref:hypothetical protein n=1 Tax=Bradyrhizobium pachyrhizi TaxID=280333 RepID=UPI002AA5108A
MQWMISNADFKNWHRIASEKRSRFQLLRRSGSGQLLVSEMTRDHYWNQPSPKRSGMRSKILRVTQAQRTKRKARVDFPGVFSQLMCSTEVDADHVPRHAKR